MAFVKKTWKDRIVQYANRRLLTKSGGEVEQVTVTRDEGTVTEAGDKFDAATMNDLEDRLEYAFDNVSTAIECTQAEYDTWKNAGQLKPQTSYIITDAPNLNPTASDIEYSSGVTVKQAIDSKQDSLTVQTITPSRYSTNVSSSGYAVSCYKYGRIVILSVSLTTERSIGNDDIMLSDLPIPQYDTIRVSLANNNSKTPIRTKITTSGYLSIHYDTVGTGETLYGIITYISAT